MARRVLAAWTSCGLGAGIGSGEEEDSKESPDEAEEEEDMVRRRVFWGADDWNRGRG
jgi:hypothetical protein